MVYSSVKNIYSFKLMRIILFLKEQNVYSFVVHILMTYKVYDGVIFLLKIKIVLDKKSLTIFFIFGGALIRGGAYLTSTHFLGGAYSRGALIRGRASNRGFTVWPF